MRGEDGFVNFAGRVNVFFADEGADDDVSIVKPQVVALVSFYLVTCSASWPPGGKKRVCWRRHGGEKNGVLYLSEQA